MLFVNVWLCFFVCCQIRHSVLAEPTAASLLLVLWLALCLPAARLPRTSRILALRSTGQQQISTVLAARQWVPPSAVNHHTWTRTPRFAVVTVKDEPISPTFPKCYMWSRAIFMWNRRQWPQWSSSSEMFLSIHSCCCGCSRVRI